MYYIWDFETFEMMQMLIIRCLRRKNQQKYAKNEWKIFWRVKVGLRQLLKDVTVKQIQIKSALEQFRRMQESTGRIYKKEIDFLLDRLNALNEYEKELNKLK